tara:strand:+ start:1647 stop:2693 length:1047 start_codon:yes stop_codon:yes gene_type:complete
MDYKSSGVDVDAGRSFIDKIKGYVEQTHSDSVIGGLGGFGGLIKLPLHSMKSPVLVAGTDGVGTKLELAQEQSSHYEVGIDLVAMCVNDVITTGAKPIFFLDYMATGLLNQFDLSQVVKGIADSCKEINCSLIGGETAEMPGFYKSGQYDLAGFCVGLVDEEKIIDGSKIQEGDLVIALESSGPHSNGFSLIRKVLSNSSILEEQVNNKAQNKLYDDLLKPTTIYANLIHELLKEEIFIKGISHITGGGLPENLPRCLPNNFDIKINLNSWEIPSLFKLIQHYGDIPEYELWNTFNLGVGLCLIVSIDDSKEVIKFCNNHNTKAWCLGEVVNSKINNSNRILGIPQKK